MDLVVCNSKCDECPGKDVCLQKSDIMSREKEKKERLRVVMELIDRTGFTDLLVRETTPIIISLIRKYRHGGEVATMSNQDFWLAYKKQAERFIAKKINPEVPDYSIFEEKDHPLIALLDLRIREIGEKIRKISTGACAGKMFCHQCIIHEPCAVAREG